MPWSVYHGKPEVLRAVLCEIASNFSSLFEHGLELHGQKFHFAMIGCKGDAEFHVSAAAMTRSYQNVGEKNDLAMCPYCDAVTSNFSDVSDSPCWLPSVACMKCLKSF